MPCRKGHGFAVSDVPNARLYLDKEQKMCHPPDMHSLGWPGPCNTWAGTAPGAIRMRPPLGRKPLTGYLSG